MTKKNTPGYWRTNNVVIHSRRGHVYRVNYSACYLGNEG